MRECFFTAEAQHFGGLSGIREEMFVSSPIVTRKKARGEVAQNDAAESTLEAATLQAILAEIRGMREEQARCEMELSARLQRQEDELQELRNQQLSRSIIREGGDPGARFVSEREGKVRVQCVKLKPDTFDGTAPLPEFFAQFDLIARASRWDDATKAVMLASCLRGKARSVLETVRDLANLEFAELKAKLELRFGEGSLLQNYYTQFTNRRQRYGEEMAALGSELERLSRLAYPECPYETRDKIACAQFISAISDNFIRRSLQMENISSLNLAIERAKTLKVIQGEFSERRGENFRRFIKEKGKGAEGTEARRFGTKERDESRKEEKGKRFGSKLNAGRECWTCGKTGHFRSECPEGKGNAN